jgi:dipeptidyl aminopeptidase/acylaminoacyl peptidase
MTFMDVVEMRSVGTPVVGPDGQWCLYTLSAPDWKSGKSYTDIYLMSLHKGLGSTRQMTFTKDKNELAPQWSRDNAYFVFSSNRDAAEGKSTNQIYMMRPDGGEAQKISDAKEGVGDYAFSKDGKWFAFTAGKDDERQLWTIAVADLGKQKPQQLSKRQSAILSWQFAPDSKRIYFISPDSADKLNRDRKEKKFDVKVRNEDSPPSHLFAVDLDTKKETKLTMGTEFSVSDFTISRDSKWIGFHGVPKDRYLRTITESNDYADLYLVDVSSGTTERLTNNVDIAESPLRFSPDNLMIAFSASDNFEYFRNSRVYVRAVTDKGGTWKELGEGFDGDVTIGFWSEDDRTIYFNEGLRATNQFFQVSTLSGKVSQITDLNASLFVSKDEDNGTVLVQYTDPRMPSDYYYVPRLDQISKRSTWIQLTNSNPQTQNIAVGETQVVQWRSYDGRTVEGIVVKPLSFEKGKRYPLIVQIHGGPADAVVLNYQARYVYYSNVYAANGYVCLLPNYRGSTNYGEKHKMEIGGDYFRKGYEDIMSGVDYLVASGIVDSTQMGVMGWSAGGHWSNWILTHTDRFKAISSGAGAVNWTSMFAESDVQRGREFYFGGKPYDHFDQYWDVSPLKYIKNAKTPTLIHVVDGDPRVPRPQSEELHMALRKLGVPTELFVYPGTTHGIPDMRNQMVKMVAEFNWMERWLRGKKTWFEWKDLLNTLKEDMDEKREAKEKD